MGFVAVMTGLFFLFGIWERTKRVRVQLLCLCGMDFVTLLFYLLTFNLRVSKVAAESGATPKTMPRLWAFLMLLASIGAYFVAHKWLEQFAEKVSLNPLYFVGASILVLAIVVLVVVLNCLRIAHANPVESLKNE